MRHYRSGDAHWLEVYKVWVKVFALTFAMGVVTGIVMSFQFGTNWPGYMAKVGNIAGPLLAYEILFAFFLEATFLGVMLFGMKRVSPGVHVFATVMVAVGTSMSAFWILALNSWMQTPAGHVWADGQIIAGSWMAVVFNPSFPYRLAHMTLASGLTASFVVAGLSAWRLLHAKDDAAALRSLRCGVVVAAVLAPIQIFVGDLHGLNTLQHQPAKIAAVEALWKTEAGAPLCSSQFRTRPSAATTFGRSAQRCEPDPHARRLRRDQGSRRIRAGYSARGRRCSSRSARWSASAC